MLILRFILGRSLGASGIFRRPISQGLGTFWESFYCRLTQLKILWIYYQSFMSSISRFLFCIQTQLLYTKSQNTTLPKSLPKIPTKKFPQKIPPSAPIAKTASFKISDSTYRKLMIALSQYHPDSNHQNSLNNFPITKLQYYINYSKVIYGDFSYKILLHNMPLKLLVLLLQVYLCVQWCLKQTYHELGGSQILEVDWSPDGNFIVTGSGSKRVTVISFATSNVVWFDTLSDVVTTAKFSKTGKWLGVGQAGDDTIRIYNVPAFTLNMTFRAEHGNTETVYQLDFNSDDTKMVTCGSDGYVNLRTISPANNNWKVPIDTSKNVISCKIASSGRVGLSCDNGRMIVLKTDGSMDGNQSKNLVKDVDFKQGTNLLYGGCTCDKVLYQMDPSGGSGSISNFFNPNKDQIWAVSYSLDTTFIAAGGKNGHTYIINASGPSLQAYYQQSTDDINSVRVSNDNNYVAVSNKIGLIYIYARNCLTCPMGFYTNGSNCRMCSLDIIGCAQCKNSSKCYLCYPNYYLDSNSVCKLCDYMLDGCSTCKSSTVCMTCAQSHYLTGSTCTKCKQTTPQCQQCMNNGTCIKCSYYTYLTVNNTCSQCKNSIPNCIACYLQLNTTSNTSSLYCRQCNQGYYASQGACVACSAHCDQCFSTGDCVACAEEYKLNGTSCIKCGTYCQSCLESGTCLECIPSTYLVNGSCSVCTFPCLTCVTAATTCRTCAPGYYFISASSTCAKCVGCPLCNPVSGACLACPLGQYIQSPANTCSYCLNTTSRCQICAASTCLACERNYYLTGSNTCARTVSITDCEIYQKNSTTSCQQCVQGLYLTTNNTCQKCPYSCSICDNSTNCSQCQLGYYLLSPNATCLPCTGLCRTCNSSTECLSCGDEYYLSGTSCLKCWLQIGNCNSCLNSTHCLDCYPGYRLASDSLSCTQCVSPCATCNSTGCLSCEEGYFYFNNSCTRCAGACVECTSAGVCQACVSGYALDGSNACVRCDSLFTNCQYCSYTACQTCKQTFTLNTTSSSCIPCSSPLPNCLTCLSPSLCKSCKTGYYPSSPSPTSCISCSTTMPNCQKCINGTTCDQCQSGFYASSANQCSRCIDGCFVCSAGGVCDVCESGFVKVLGVCRECGEWVFGCKMCTLAGGCLECGIGYYLSNSSCLLCRSAMEGCSVCSSATTCQSCDAGYFKNSTNKCQKCSSTIGCSLCTSTSSCLQCQSGYFLNSTQCQLCSTLSPNCAICNTTTCLRCDTGSYLNNGTCTTCTATYGQACIVCNGSQCLQCQSGMYVGAGGTGSCLVCGIVGCELCGVGGIGCLSCQDLYYRAGTGCSRCDGMDIGCLSCTGLNSCSVCKTGYYLESNGSCILCSKKYPGCDICTSTQCSTCKTNYYHNTTSLTGTCLLCNQLLPGCSLCLSQSQCLLCESGYFLNNMQCTSCTTINQCMICNDNTTCLFCGAGYYLGNGQCLSCSAAIPGCFSCVSATMCTTCSGSFSMLAGACVEVKGVVPQNYTEVRIVSEYVNGTHLKHTLFSSKTSFRKIQQKWSQVTKIELVTPPNNKTVLTILSVEWGPSAYSNALVFYTNNPFGEISSASSAKSMPMVKFQRRLLLSLQDLNMQINFNMQKSAIKQLLPQLDTDGQDFATEYKLDNPEFYKSIVKNEKYYYYLFGIAVMGILVFMYFVKICCVLPMTNDAGEILPHVLLMKIPAMVMYPTLGGYIDFCYGFTYLDFPWLNQYFSAILTNPQDKSPPSYQMFYKNLNLPSTYLLALLIFLTIFTPLFLYSLYKSHKKSPIKKLTQRKSTAFNQTKQTISVLEKPIDRLEIFREFLYNVFIAGLAVSSFGCVIGMSYNPATVVSGQGAFYILGILIYTVVVLDAVKSFVESKAKFNKIRVVIKATFMAFLFWSPVPLFSAMAFIDIAIMLYQYNLKLKEWVVPKIWLLNQTLILTSYGALIFLSNMLIGIIVACVCTVVVLGLDGYLQYAEHLEIEKIKDLRSRSRDYTENNLSIQGFVPDRKEIMEARVNDLYFQEPVEVKKLDKSDLYNRASVRVPQQDKNQTKSSLNSTFQASSMDLSNLSKQKQKEARNTFTIKGLYK